MTERNPPSRLQADILWVAMGNLVSAIALLGMMKVWAVYLEPADLGQMALVIGAACILVGIVLGPLFQAIFVGYSEHARRGYASLFRSVSGGMTRQRVLQIATAVGIAGGPVAWYFGLHWTMPLAVIGLFAVDAVRIFEMRLLAAARRQRELAMIAAGDVIFRLVFVWLLLARFDQTASAAVIGNLLGALLFAVIVRLAFALEGLEGTRTHSDGREREISEEISRLAKPLLPSMVLANLTEMGNRYFIGATIGLHATGMFVVAYGFVKRPYGMLNNVAEMTMTPVLRDAITEGRAGDVARTRYAWLGLMVIFCAAGAALFYVLREPLVSILLSDRYAEAADMFFGIAVAVAFFNLSNVFNWFSVTLGNSRAVLINNIVGSTATVVLTVTLCLSIGLAGAVWALVVGYSLQLFASILTFWLAHKRHAYLESDENSPDSARKKHEINPSPA